MLKTVVKQKVARAAYARSFEIEFFWTLTDSFGECCVFAPLGNVEYHNTSLICMKSIPATGISITMTSITQVPVINWRA